MHTREEMIAELQRVAKHLSAQSVSKRDYERHGEINLASVLYGFGSWNRAIKAAGLKPFEHRMRKGKYSDAELMAEMVRLTRELGKAPSDREMGSMGRFSPKPYEARWGTFAKARFAAYEALGYPELPNSKL